MPVCVLNVPWTLRLDFHSSPEKVSNYDTMNHLGQIYRLTRYDAHSQGLSTATWHYAEFEVLPYAHQDECQTHIPKTDCRKHTVVMLFSRYKDQGPIRGPIRQQHGRFSQMSLTWLRKIAHVVLGSLVAPLPVHQTTGRSSFGGRGDLGKEGASMGVKPVLFKLGDMGPEDTLGTTQPRHGPREPCLLMG